MNQLLGVIGLRRTAAQAHDRLWDVGGAGGGGCIILGWEIEDGSVDVFC
jgi:hypothetical protein